MPLASDVREEVVRGEVRRMPPNKWEHSRIVRRFRRAIESQVDAADVEVVDGNFGLVISTSPLTTRVPDLAVFRTVEIVERDGYIHSPPGLIVEVLSPGNSDEDVREKLRDYESIGVPEVWVASHRDRVVEVWRMENSVLATVDRASGSITPLHFPLVTVRVAEVWPD